MLDVTLVSSMSYLPRPDYERTAQDVDEIYTLTAEELQQAETPEERRRAFRLGLLRAYEGGIDAQREILADYTHDRPTPVPPPPTPVPGPLDDDPGTLSPTSRRPKKL
jgi:signal transduction histidine kinase